MRPITTTSVACGLGLAVATAGSALIAAPAAAQAYDPAYAPAYDTSTVEGLTVVGRRGPNGPNTLSRVISIADLDLRYERDVREMRERVRHTAREICADLGETGGGSGVVRSCEDDAVRSADRQTRVAIAQARSNVEYAYVAPVYPPPYAGEYAPPASAVIPVPYDEDPPI